MDRGDTGQEDSRSGQPVDAPHHGEDADSGGRYGLVCRGCAFERTVVGLDPALDWMGRHKAETGEDHSVDVYAFGYLTDLAAKVPPAEATELERRAMALVRRADSVTNDPTAGETTTVDPTADDPMVDD